MKVAITHDWLNQKMGGAENVLFELAQMYPSADIYALVYNPELFQNKLEGRKIITSRLNSFPSFMRHRPQLLLPFVKKAVEKWDFAGYDLVISSSTAWVKNVNVPKRVKHICYCHSPARMLWDSWPKYLEKFRLGPLRRYYIARLASKLRLWDYYQAQNGTVFVANSKYVAGRISKYYHQPAKVIYPPVELIGQADDTEKQDYYLIVSVLSTYKNVDLAIKAFSANGKRLVIAGSGPDAERLRTLAADYKNIEFVGRVNEQRKRELYLQAKAFVFCSVEDFGITMVEAISAGTPVIALRGGGAEEIITPGKTGVFFDESTETALNRCIEKFEITPDLKGKINTSGVQRFDSGQFVKGIKSEVADVCK